MLLIVLVVWISQSDGLSVFFQIAGLLSAIIVMIVTLAIGFLLEPLPKVRELQSAKEQHCQRIRPLKGTLVLAF